MGVSSAISEKQNLNINSLFLFLSWSLSLRYRRCVVVHLLGFYANDQPWKHLHTTNTIDTVGGAFIYVFRSLHTHTTTTIIIITTTTTTTTINSNNVFIIIIIIKNNNNMKENIPWIWKKAWPLQRKIWREKTEGKSDIIDL